MPSASRDESRTVRPSAVALRAAMPAAAHGTALNQAARAYKARGIVLRARNLGEADKIITLFTDVHGKVGAVAKGVRRPKSRLAGRLEFAGEVVLGMHRGRALDVITSADLVAPSFANIVVPGAYATAHILAELIDAFCEPDLAMPDVYALLRGALRALGKTADPTRLVPRFEVRLLAALGFGPQCDSCIRCGADVAAAGWADVEAGGLTCESCRPHGAAALFLECADIANFRALAAARGGALPPTLHATAATARAIDAFVAWQLGRRPKASKVLADIAYV